MSEINLVTIFNTASQTQTLPANIIALVWEGTTSAGDTVTIKRIGGANIWTGRTAVSNTYLGITFSDIGLRVSEGIECSQISSGQLYVYQKVKD